MAPSSIALLSNQLPTFTKLTWMTHLGHVQIIQLNYLKAEISSSLTQITLQVVQTIPTNATVSKDSDMTF